MGEKIDLSDYYTVPDINKKYDVSQSTLRAYLLRKQVIPEEEVLRIGRTWLISKDWVDEFYKDKKR